MCPRSPLTDRVHSPPARSARTLVTVAVRPSDSTGALSEETPGVGLSVRVPAVVVVSQPPARVLHDVVWKLGPFQTWDTGVGLGHGAVVVSQLSEPLGAGQRHCRRREEIREGDVVDESGPRRIWVREDHGSKTEGNGEK